MTAIEDPPSNYTEVSVWIRIVRSPWPRLVLLTTLLAVLGWFAITNGTAALDAARSWTARMGATGAVAFVLIFALATLALFPATPLMAAAGLLYGPVLGVLLVWCGSVLAATGSFLLGRLLSRQAVEQLAGSRIDRLNALFTTRAIATMLLLRLIPVFPFALVNYGSAITAITLRQYLIGTTIGVLPPTIAYVWLGDGIEDPTSPAFIAALTILLTLAVGGTLAARRLSRRT
ncbi:MAG: TVP38/TMEM64 family protein [Pseudonocardiaceae bacterium]